MRVCGGISAPATTTTRRCAVWSGDDARDSGGCGGIALDARGRRWTAPIVVAGLRPPSSCVCRPSRQPLFCAPHSRRALSLIGWTRGLWVLCPRPPRLLAMSGSSLARVQPPPPSSTPSTPRSASGARRYRRSCSRCRLRLSPPAAARIRPLLSSTAASPVSGGGRFSNCSAR